MNPNRFHSACEVARWSRCVNCCIHRVVVTSLMIATCSLGCIGCAQSHPQESVSLPPPAATMPATRPSARQCFRLSQAVDLQVSLATRRDPTDHFPLATVKVYNVAGDEVIVAYQPGSVVVHCGDFELPGPPVTFVERREILRSQQPMVFEIGSEGWMRSPSRSNGDLLLPIDLPPGRYPIWATFRMGGEGGPVIESAHDWYTVP